GRRIGTHRNGGENLAEVWTVMAEGIEAGIDERQRIGERIDDGQNGAVVVKIGPHRALADRDSVGEIRIDLILFAIDDGDRAAALIEDEGAAAVGAHDAVDGTSPDGQPRGDGAVHRLNPGGNAVGAGSWASAVIRTLTNGIHALRRIVSDDIDRILGN